MDGGDGSGEKRYSYVRQRGASGQKIKPFIHITPAAKKSSWQKGSFDRLGLGDDETEEEEAAG